LLKQLDTFLSRTDHTGSAACFLDLIGARALASVVPHLAAIPVSRGSTLFAISDGGEHVYFPHGTIISLEQRNGVEVALVGSEGLVGWSALVGCNSSPFGATVCGGDGMVLRVRTELIRRIMFETPAVGLAVNGFINVMSVQMSEAIGAHASHRIDVRLARWILLRHDRADGDMIIAQHQEIADNLGARRASVTDGLHILEGHGWVRCRRGRIYVQNREGLERIADGCYGAAEAFYRGAIGAFGKTPGAKRVEVDGQRREASHPCAGLTSMTQIA